MAVKWDAQHTLVLVGATLLGAMLGYIEQQDATTLMQAFQSSVAMKHMIVSAVVVGLSALVALAKQSFLVAPTNGNGQAAPPDAPHEQKANPSSFPKKAASMRLRSEMRIAGKLAFAFCISMAVPLATTIVTGAMVVTTACSSIWKDPVYIAQQLAQYVTLFIQTAQTVWSSIAPLLGSNEAADTAAFKEAIFALQNANAIMIDAAQAIAAGKNGPNLAQLIQAVQDAVSRVMAVIAQFQGSEPAARVATADKMANLSRMATSIAHWQQEAK